MDQEEKLLKKAFLREALKIALDNYQRNISSAIKKMEQSSVKEELRKGYYLSYCLATVGEYAGVLMMAQAGFMAFDDIKIWPIAVIYAGIGLGVNRVSENLNRLNKAEISKLEKMADKND